MHVWGWRLPFLLGFVVAGFGLWMRNGLVESPDFERQKSSGQIGKSPVLEAIKTMPATMVEMFPTRTRFSAIAIGYNISLALFGGTTPMITPG